MFWEKLKSVTQITLHTKSGWHGTGKVLITEESDTVLVFHEKGLWQPEDLAFHNTLRWTLEGETISLEHLRLGYPVFLLHLVPTGSNTLASVTPHLCEEDTYLAQVLWDHYSIRLSWRVIGPHKNEEMEYNYLC